VLLLEGLVETSDERAPRDGVPLADLMGFGGMVVLDQAARAGVPAREERVLLVRSVWRCNSADYVYLLSFEPLSMALAPGTRLGPYEVIGLLGAGGMGEVYNARDTRLNRLIALKLLPTAAAGDADRRDRFEREAQVIAALSHPNIVTLHSVERIDGQFLLTMELVDGRSLAEAIPVTGLPLDRLLAIAIPVVDAIAAAHQRGITHRDLKPANIMIGEGEQAGRVKVLDFGLAKLADAPAAAAGVTALPTAPITGEGQILGTVAYMSPEQAEGKAIDARSDLFSFGVMLYEMATGQRPFAGDTNISIISSILKDTPKSVTDLKPALPRDLARVVRRALLKDPDRRYQTAKDLRSDLEELKTSLDSGELMSSVTTSPEAVRSGVPLWWLAAVGVVAVLAIAASYLVARRASPGGTARASLPNDDLQITALTTSGNAERPAISPDGKYVAYIQHDHNDYSLWIRQTATSRNVQIVVPEAGVELADPTVTPDGNYVDFVKQESTRPVATLWRVALLGGAPRRIVDNVSSTVGWSPDSRHLAFVRADLASSTTALVIADSDGSHERVVKTRHLPAIFPSLVYEFRQRPAWSPDRASIAVTGRDTSQPNGSQFHIAVIDVTSGTEHVMPVEGGAETIAWLSSDALVASRTVSSALGQPQLWRITYPGGQFSRLTNDLNVYRGLDLTADRTSLVTERREVQAGIWVGDASARAGTEIVPPTARPLSGVTWLGNRLLYTSAANRSAPVVIAVDPMSKVAEEMSFSNARAPAATADGRVIVFVSVESGPEGGTLWKTGIDGSRPVRLLEWSPIGNPRFALGDRQVVFGAQRGGQQSLWIMPLEGGTPTQLSPMLAASFDVSPDGASLAFVSLKDGSAALIVCALPACVPRTVPTAANFGPAPLRWMPDGRAIAYVDSKTQLNLWAQPMDGGPAHLLTHFDDGHTIANFEWSRDGRNLAISRAVTNSDIVLFKGLQPISGRQ
jgi:serine/threonine protein kinase